MANQCGAQALASGGGVDKQGFHVAVVDEHEGEWVVLRINGQPERRLGQEAADQHIQGGAVVRLQKVVGGVHGLAPDLDGAWAIFGAGRANGDHRGIMHRPVVLGH